MRLRSELRLFNYNKTSVGRAIAFGCATRCHLSVHSLAMPRSGPVDGSHGGSGGGRGVGGGRCGGGRRRGIFSLLGVIMAVLVHNIKVSPTQLYVVVCLNRM